MSKLFKGNVTNNVVELNLLDAVGTPTIVTRNTGPNDVTQVVGDITSSSGFYFDRTAKGLVIGTSCTSIGSMAFYFCTNLTGDLVIPDSVTFIGDNSFIFGGFDGSLTIGNGVTAIEDAAFFNCSSITSVNILATTAPTIGNAAFSDMTAVSPAEIHVPVGATGYAASYNGLTVVYDL